NQFLGPPRTAGFNRLLWLVVLRSTAGLSRLLTGLTLYRRTFRNRPEILTLDPAGLSADLVAEGPQVVRVQALLGAAGRPRPSRHPSWLRPQHLDLADRHQDPRAVVEAERDSSGAVDRGVELVAVLGLIGLLQRDRASLDADRRAIGLAELVAVGW